MTTGSEDIVRHLPGQRPVAWRRSSGLVILAIVLGIAWPPLVATLFYWPPNAWLDGLNTDWRIQLLVLGAVCVPLCLWLVGRERDRSGRPGSRLGVVWRFILYGGLLSALLQVVNALFQSGLGMMHARGVGQALGYAETALLIFGVGGLPLAVVVGVSYALWAGLCAAFLAFEPRPERVRDRLGILDHDPSDR